MSNLHATAPDAGWYPDAQSPVIERYWDGQSWTQHTRPFAVPHRNSLGTDPSSALHWIVPVGRSWQSVLAPYLGVFGLVFCLFPPIGITMGVLATGFGVWAMVRAQSGGHGRGRAILAMIAGLGTIALSLMVLNSAA